MSLINIRKQHTKNIVLFAPKHSGKVNVFDAFMNRLPLNGILIMFMIARALGYNVKVYCENICEAPEKDWKKVVAKADLVGITAITPLAEEAYKLVVKARKCNPEAVIVGGGFHFGYKVSEAISRGIDIVVTNEGEITFPLLLETLFDNGSKDLRNVPGIAFSDGNEIIQTEMAPPVNFSQIPIPMLDVVEGYKKVPRLHPFKTDIFQMETSRGCPNRCIFCSVWSHLGKMCRFRDTEETLDALSQVCADSRALEIFFLSDNFGMKRRVMLEIASGIEPCYRQNKKIRWSAQGRADRFFLKDGSLDHEILASMRSSGCRGWYMGAESIFQESLDAMNKGLSVEETEASISALREYGIWVHAMFVVGGDKYYHFGDALKMAKWARKVGANSVQIFPAIPLPGTKLTGELETEGRILPNLDWSYYNGNYVVIKPYNAKASELQLDITNALSYFYSMRNVIKPSIFDTTIGIYGAWNTHRFRKYESEPYIAYLKSIGQ